MKKLILFLILFIAFIPLTLAEETNNNIETEANKGTLVLKGCVTTQCKIDAAREEAFVKVEYSKDLSWAPSIDPYFKENQIAKKTGTKTFKNRLVTFFGDGGYCVKEFSSVNTFCFDKGGALEEVHYDLNDGYPKKIFMYNYPASNLESIGYSISPSEGFVFMPNGILKQYCKGRVCFDQKGSVNNIRDSIEF
ncbi:MAG: hypothetical protein AB1782_04815 [Cyanobacteriota bacterium]